MARVAEWRLVIPGAGERVAPGVLHVVTAPESFGFLRGQPEFMRTRGYELAGASSPGAQTEFFSAAGAQVFPVPMRRRITPFRDLVAIWKLVRVMRAWKPVIVHAHTPKAGLLGMIAATLSRVPVRIYHIRGLPYMTASGRRRRLLTTTERVSARLATRVLCVSHSLRAVAVEDGIVSADKVRTLAKGSGNGVDAVGRFRPSERTFVLGGTVRDELGIPRQAIVLSFIGRVVVDKGILELATAWARLRRSGHDVFLLLVGPEEPFDPVPESVLRPMRDDDRVRMLGRVADTVGIYGASDLIVLPTYREGLPNTLLEAAAMGLPAVATRIPGCVDVVEDGETGTLVAPRDAGELHDAIAAYCADPALRARHGAAARARVLQFFDRQRVWSALADEYDELMRAVVA